MLKVTCYFFTLGLSLIPTVSVCAESNNNSLNNIGPSKEEQLQPSAPLETREQLFQHVFKRPAPEITFSSNVAVVVDNDQHLKVKAEISPNGKRLLLEAKALLAFLANVIRPSTLQSLEAQADDDGWLNQEVFEKLGISSSFDERKFELSLVTSPEMRLKKVQHLNAQAIDPFSTNALRPAAVSAYLNFDLKYSAENNNGLMFNSNNDRLGVAANGAFNMKEVVLEGSVFGDYSATNSSLRRSNFRLVYDQPQQAIRYSAGDLYYQVFGYQTNMSIGGIGVSRDFSLQPHLDRYRTGEFHFQLDSESEVEVWVNASLIRTLYLPAGTHDIRGLSLTTGLNDTRLIIEDNAGRRKELFFSFIHNPILLEKGKTSFSYNAGFLREMKDGGFYYNSDKPIISASYSMGYSDETTFSGYGQLGLSRALFGMKTFKAFAGGVVQFELATSRSATKEWEFGSKIEWTGTPNRHKGEKLQSQVLVEYREAGFGPITTSSLSPKLFSSLTSQQKSTLRVQASLASPLPYGISGRLGIHYSTAQNDDLVDAYGATASFAQRWGDYISANVELRHNRSSLNESRTERFFGINFNIPFGKGSFSASKELESNTLTSRWNSGRQSNSSSSYGFASSRLNSNMKEYEAGYGYMGNQGLVEASYTKTVSDKTAVNTANKRDRQTLRLQSAVVMAEGTFALSRPVRQNFLIIKGQEGLSNIEMKVDPDSSGGSRARSGLLGPAVVTDMQNYRLRDVKIEPVNPPLGASPEKLSFSLLPYYKSGFVLKLGETAKLIAIGKLVDGNQKPVAHLRIRIQSLDNPEFEPILTFTSRNGRFQLPDIKPGRYEIFPASETMWGSTIFEVQTTEEDLVRLGNLGLNSKNKVIKKRSL